MVRGLLASVCVWAAAAAAAAATALPGPGPAGFPVGVILSDRLYPLVVGRDLDTGAPFVANLDRQHALVVARGGAHDYRMVIPFPTVVGSPHVGSGRLSSNAPHHYPSYGRGRYSGSRYSDAYGSSKSPSEHASDYRSHRNYYGDGDDKRKDSPPKKYAQAQTPDYINYFGVERKAPPAAAAGKYVPFSIDRPASRYRLKNYTRYLGPDGGLSYRVAGPQSPYDSPPDGGFKPSQYLGDIPDDGPHSEEFESYDDREPDYIETSSRTSGEPGPVAESGGGVHHVTHHADDYLGKIYEDMYYKVAPGTYSDGPPSYEEEEAVESRRQRNATEAAPSRTGPVTFAAAAAAAPLAPHRRQSRG